MLRTLFLLTAAAAWLAAVPAATADVYRFKDDQGNVLYTDKPSTLPAERLNIQSQKTDVVAVQARQQEDAKRQQDADRAAQQAASQSSQQQAAQPPTNDKADQCTKARQRYESYMNSQKLYEQQADGQRRYLSDTELDAARASAKASMDVICK